MSTYIHWAVFGSGLSVESGLINDLLKGEGPYPFENLRGKKGELFSNVTLNRFIKEEALHDDFTLTCNNRRSIRTFSSGEQKKALLCYLLSRNPEFIILENAFDMLDKTSQEQLLASLNNLSASVTIIQIFHRKTQILPFINRMIGFQNQSVIFEGTVADYHEKFHNATPFAITGDIPQAPVVPNPMSNPLIAFNNVSVNYEEKSVLDSICWVINQGEFWQLIGPNGAGKTTLLTMITGDNPQAYGQDLMLFGRKKGTGESIWDIKKKIGYITPAMTVLFNGWHTVENMIISGIHDSIGLYKKPSRAEQELSQQWLALIGMAHMKKTLFADLTEEQQCMVLIARSMIKHPPLLILDEPTHGLNDYQVSVLVGLINKIASQCQTTIIYVSHKHEAGLQPQYIFELVPGNNGSKGIIHHL